jgi:hypothetical protein
MFQRGRLNHQPVKIAVVFHGTIPTGVSSLKCWSFSGTGDQDEGCKNDEESH